MSCSDFWPDWKFRPNSQSFLTLIFKTAQTSSKLSIKSDLSHETGITEWQRGMMTKKVVEHVDTILLYVQATCCTFKLLCADIVRIKLPSVPFILLKYGDNKNIKSLLELSFQFAYRKTVNTATLKQTIFMIIIIINQHCVGKSPHTNSIEDGPVTRFLCI